ncbi:50S ribosomal protein L17 [Falseniella ignava]|uniref:Large ribosomal subunit protein bL17 n=2 Tax=Falseniella ignava TaxID=137730 RepID=K1M887_9LACT|nr:50S ribosomal protein L17 [Falseniella ignava]EKB58588.1 50S ribosomal protein L17 [Falseniella ignava CCUG 37419]PKY90726.1 50S ribosomal protein L17 [Falseniella ignava]
MSYRKLGRTSSQRKAMLRDLTTDVLINERIETTEARAKEVRKFVDKMITLGKKGDLASRRKAASFLRRELADVRVEEDELIIQSVLDRLFDDYATRYAERNGGYTRILKKGPRRGDAAQMVILELV